MEDLIPSAKKLKEIGIGFVEALVWIDCIKDVAQKEGVDERTGSVETSRHAPFIQKP